MSEEKCVKYAAEIFGKIMELFDEDIDSQFKIDLTELEKDDNLTHFFHALATMAPAAVYSKFTGNRVNAIEFNHIANRLVMQLSKREETK